MRAFIVTTFIGTFGVDENKKIVSFRPFPKSPSEMAERFKLSEIEVIDEEKNMQQDLWKKGYKEFVFCVRKTGVKHAEPNNEIEKSVKENLRKFAVDYNIAKDQAEFNQLLTKVNLELTKVKIKISVGRDSLVIQTNRTIEELDKAINILVERLREWYGLHFPEMDRVVSDHQKFVKIIEKYGSRDNIEDPEISLLKDKSMGIDLNKDDTETIKLFSKKILEMYQLRESLAKYLDKTLREVAPNLRELAGPQLSAKLIARVGGLDKLSKMSSSTLQLIGAEKSLFRYLHSKGKGRSPKYGLIFMHPLIQNAPNDKRGKVARVLSSKFSIAAKMDFYSKEYKGDQLKHDLQERVKEILSSK